MLQVIYCMHTFGMCTAEYIQSTRAEGLRYRMYDKFNSSLLVDVFSHFERMCCIKTEVKSQLIIEDFLLY